MKNLKDFYKILHKHRPSSLCLQKTHLKPTETNLLSQYSVFRRDGDSCTYSSSGVEIVTQKSVPCHSLHLLIALAAVALRAIIFNGVLAVCCFSIPPDESWVWVSNRQASRTFLISRQPQCSHWTLGVWTDRFPGPLAGKVFFCHPELAYSIKKQWTYYSTAHHRYSHINLAIGVSIPFSVHWVRGWH